MQHNFEEVSVKGTVKWKEDGKTRQKTRKFYQTISPFNKNDDGTQKTRTQIRAEITSERDEWVRMESVNEKVSDGGETK